MASLSKPQQPISSDEALNLFLEYLLDQGIEPYDHQEEAILELFAGKNVILNTPTGSGKSLVAMAMQFKALCENRISYYTVPIKALANEKFLSLCKIFGPEQVGMITGDATVNPTAPIICCTAEILSNLSLREGAETPVDDVIMDEFHYYSDHSRGSAWQIPLLTLPNARFLLMSATLGNTQFFVECLNDLTGADTALVQSNDRPVPLEFQYSETTLEEKVVELVEQNKAPVYLVHFTQLACARSGQNLISSNFCSKEEKKQIAEELQDANFRSPYGKEVNKLLRHGIGIHHAGLLPKYRVLVEKLTQKGLLKVICGTDTLGVGVNVPIRTVVYTQLCKFDGQGTGILTVRDFKQISGRAGRKGFDNIGYVVCQAPPHMVENLKLEAKSLANPNKKKKFVKKKPPEKGFVNWDEATFRRLIDAEPEKLVSRFSIQHSTLLNVLSRSFEDGCAALQNLIEASHDTTDQKKAHRSQAFQLFRGLVEGKIFSIIPPAERAGPSKIELNFDLPDDFSLNHALGLYLIDTLPELDKDEPEYVLNLLSMVEAILEHPAVILRRQVDVIKDHLVAEMKQDGVEYDERMARLEEVEWPKPGKDFIYATFNEFVAKHPWLEESNIRPKSIAREMFENYQSFEDYVDTYGLQKCEGVLLRHLSEVFKVLVQTVPPSAKTEEVDDAEAFFEDILLGVDSSLLDEWEKLRNPDYVPEEKRQLEERDVPITRNTKAFTRQVRNLVFDVVKQLAYDQPTAALELLDPGDWDVPKIDAALDLFYEENERIRLDPEARNAKNTRIDTEDSRHWKIEQILIDPEENNAWSLHVSVDLERSDQEKRPVAQFKDLRKML